MKNKIGIFLTSLLLSLIFATNVFAANINFSIDGIVVTSTTAVINGKIISSDFTQTLPHIYLYVGTTNETNIKTVSHIKGQLDQNTLNQPQNNALQFNELVQNLTPNTQYKYLISSAAGTSTSTLTNSITEKTGTFQTTASGSAITETTPPTTYTKPVINVFGSAVTLAGQAQNNYQPIEFRFKYGSNSTNLDESTGFFPQHNSTSTFFGITESFQKEITTYHGQPLIDGAMYYYVACAKNTFGESCDTAHVESFSPKKNQTILTPNTSGTESGKWWFKQTKDGEANGPFSNIAECETERAKGNSYSKQCFQFYYPLAPLPGQADKIDTSSSGDSDCPFGNYLNILIKLFIGICAVLAMIKIVLGGMQYMTSELSSGKEDGKNSITSAVFGLILALGAFAILNTINPELLKVCLNNLPKAVVQVEEIERKISNQSGNGICAVITDQNNPCYPSKLASSFSGTTNATAPFNTLAAQASAICMLESSGKSDMPNGLNPNIILDKCSDNKPFSFGLFQINASAHRNDIPACNGAFNIPTGHGASQGNALEFYTAKNGAKYPSKWSCTTVEPAYTACKNYLTNPINNINFAATSTSLNKWNSWSTYNSCKVKF